MDFRNFSIFYVFEVKESISGSFTKLPCSGDLENPGQLPILQVLEGTDDWVLWIFVSFSFPTFLMSMNPFSTVSQSYHVRMSLKIQVNFRFYECLRLLMIGVLMDFYNSFSLYVSRVQESIFPSFTKLSVF